MADCYRGYRLEVRCVMGDEKRDGSCVPMNDGEMQRGSMYSPTSFVRVSVGIFKKTEKNGTLSSSRAFVRGSLHSTLC